MHLNVNGTRYEHDTLRNLRADAAAWLRFWRNRGYDICRIRHGDYRADRGEIHGYMTLETL